MEECKHEQVLAIYECSTHTKYNISHYFCPHCSKKETSSFGIKIIYDHDEVKLFEAKDVK